jgi:hypothetical protein
MELIKLITWHKKVTLKIYLQNIIRKWRFVSTMNTLSRKKLSKLLKNMQISYLTAAEEMFSFEEENTELLFETSSKSKESPRLENRILDEKLREKFNLNGKTKFSTNVVILEEEEEY